MDVLDGRRGRGRHGVRGDGRDEGGLSLNTARIVVEAFTAEDGAASTL